MTTNTFSQLQDLFFFKIENVLRFFSFYFFFLRVEKRKNRKQKKIESVLRIKSCIRYIRELKSETDKQTEHLVSEPGFLKISQDLAGLYLAGQELKLK